MANSEVVRLSDGEVTLWTDEDRSIHLKAVSSFGDPIELNAEEATELANELLRLAALVG